MISDHFAVKTSVVSTVGFAVVIENVSAVRYSIWYVPFRRLPVDVSTMILSPLINPCPAVWSCIVTPSFASTVPVAIAPGTTLATPTMVSDREASQNMFPPASTSATLSRATTCAELIGYSPFVYIVCASSSTPVYALLSRIDFAEAGTQVLAPGVRVL